LATAGRIAIVVVRSAFAAPSQVKKALGTLVLALVCVPVSQGAVLTQRTSDAGLPARGVLTPGVSLAGVHIGDSVTKVKRLWGSNYKLCPDCDAPTWFYFYTRGEPLGAAVRFKDGHVVAAFTLGAPTGWHTAEGLLVGEQIYRVADLYGPLGWHRCIGYGAMTMRKGDVVTSIYTTGQVVYGFAITKPSEPICQ
jgi:hypothetical protein